MKTNHLTPNLTLIECSGPTRKGTGQEQGEVCSCSHRWEQHTRAASGAEPCKYHGCGCSNYSTVIITPDASEPDTCLWCVVAPASPDYYPYCGIDCATASAIDDERGCR